MDKVELFDVTFDNYDYKDLMMYIENAIGRGEPTYVVTCKIGHLVKLKKDVFIRRVYDEAGVTVADGGPIVWASHWFGTPLKRRVADSDILSELGYDLERKRYRIFLIGSSEGVTEEAKEQLLYRFPALNIIGCYSTSDVFEENDEENRKMLEKLQEAKPDIVLIGIDSPYQEKWIYRYYREYKAPVSIGIGETFDLLTGRIKRVPAIMQRGGLTWLWRLLTDPRRSWRRYIIEEIEFLKLIFREYKEQRKRERRKSAFSQKR